MENLSILDVILVFQWLGAAAFLLFLVVMSAGLSRLKSVESNDYSPFVSVIIPARNEEENIAACLDHILNQSYAPDNYEVIVVDDHSEDATFELCRFYANGNNRIRLLSLGDYDGVSPKKAALQLGISASRGEIILTTDADCRASSTWIEVMVRHFDEETGAVASWLLVREDARLLSKLEMLDSLALVLIGAAGFGLGRPFIANGANFGYRKQVYRELNGFDGVADYVSGDDDLFLQKIVASKKWKCRFAADVNGAVYTLAQRSFKDFLAQRSRWASKGGIYPVWLVALQISIYFYYLTIAVAAGAFVFSGFTRVALIAPFLIKLVADFLFLKNGANKVARTVKVRFLFPAEWLQLFYILVVGVRGVWGTYTWKGRTYTRGKIEVD